MFGPFKMFSSGRLARVKQFNFHLNAKSLWQLSLKTIGLNQTWGQSCKNNFQHSLSHHLKLKSFDWLKVIT